MRLERWAIIATIVLYVAAVASLIILLGERLLPEGSPARRAFHNAANQLNRLGDIASGTIIIIILLVLAGGGIYVLILKAIDKYHANRERRARERAEWEAAARDRGHLKDLPRAALKYSTNSERGASTLMTCFFPQNRRPSRRQSHSCRNPRNRRLTVPSKDPIRRDRVGIASVRRIAATVVSAAVSLPAAGKASLRIQLEMQSGRRAS